MDRQSDMSTIADTACCTASCADSVAYRPGGRGGKLPPGAAVEGAQNRAKVGFMQLLNKPKVAYSFTIVNLLGSTSL